MRVRDIDFGMGDLPCIVVCIGLSKIVFILGPLAPTTSPCQSYESETPENAFANDWHAEPI